jgi:hypothetical protein
VTCYLYKLGAWLMHLFMVQVGCHIFVAHIKEGGKDKVEGIEDHPIFMDFEYCFGDNPRFPPKRYIDSYIYLVLGITPMSKTPYKMGKPELKELHMHLEELLRKGYICRSVSPWDALVLFVKIKDGTLRLCI